MLVVLPVPARRFGGVALISAAATQSLSIGQVAAVANIVSAASVQSLSIVQAATMLTSGSLPAISATATQSLAIGQTATATAVAGRAAMAIDTLVNSSGISRQANANGVMVNL